MVKNLPANAGDARDVGSIPGAGKIPCRRKWLPISVFLPGESHGQSSLAGYSPWGPRVGHDWSGLTTMSRGKGWRGSPGLETEVVLSPQVYYSLQARGREGVTPRDAGGINNSHRSTTFLLLFCWSSLGWTPPQAMGRGSLHKPASRQSGADAIANTLKNLIWQSLSSKWSSLSIYLNWNYQHSWTSQLVLCILVVSLVVLFLVFLVPDTEAHNIS